jgi:hypothetical protein
MKTNMIKLKTLATAFVISGLFFTGCEKEEPSSLISDANEPARLATANTTNLAENNQVFSLVTIEQQPGKTMLPSYKVDLSSNGTVKFTGIANTAVIGPQVFEVSNETLDQITTLFTAGSFNRSTSLPYVPDVPLCVTTFQDDMNSAAISRIDYLGQQSEATSFRVQVINLLQLNRLIGTDIESIESASY